MLFYAIANYICYPWPEKFAIFSSLLMAIFLIINEKTRENIFFSLQLPTMAILSILLVGAFVAVISSIAAIPQLALPLALVYGIFVTGISLVKSMELTELFDDFMEYLLISYIIGATYLGVLTLFASFIFNFPNNRFFLLVVIIIHTLHLFIIYLRNNDKTLNIYISVKQALFAILWFLLLFIFFSLYYSSNVFLPGLDILRHYAASVNIIRNPWKFLQIYPDNYLIFHSFEGAIMLLANYYDAYFLDIVLLLINVLNALALAQMISSALGERTPLFKQLAFLYYLVFSGLGFLYIFMNKPGDASSYINVLATGNEKLHRGLMYITSRLTFMWPTPQAFSLTAFLLFLSLIFKSFEKQYSSYKFIVIGAWLIFAMMVTHPPQAIVGIALYALLVILAGRNYYYILKMLSLGVLIGSIIGAIFNVIVAYISYSYLFRGGYLILLRLITFFLPFLAVLFALALSKLNPGLKFIFLGRYCCCKALSIVGVLLMFLGIFVSLDPSNTFTLSRADPGGVMGIVPWFIYVVWLGVALPLGLRGFERLACERRNIIVTVFGALMILSIVMGRLNSYLNASGIDTGYWGEQRFILYIYIALATPTIYELGRFVRGGTLKVVIVGFLSALLAINALVVASYWGIVGERDRISKAEMEATNKLSELLWANPSRWVLTPTVRSREISIFAAPIYYVYSDPSYSWRWQAPELSLGIFNVWGLDPPYIYINWAIDTSIVRSGWIGRVLLPRLPKLFSVGLIDVYDVPSLAPPVPNGSVALAIPPVWDESVDEAYLLLSLAGVNFTSVLEIDPVLYSYRVIVVPYDPLVKTRTVTVDLLKSPIAFTGGAVKINVNSIELGGRPEKSGLIVWRNSFYLLPELLNFTVRFEVRECNPELLNYFFFVYDFQDGKNYKYAGVMFTRPGQVYAFNCSLTEGRTICSPPFPGVLMGKVFNLTGEHLMRVSLDTGNRRLCLALDSLTPVCFTSSYAGGQIGLRTDRFWLVNVKNVLLEAKVSSHMDEKKLEAGNYILLVLKKELDMPFKNSFGNTRIFYMNIGEISSDLRQAIEFIREILSKQTNEDFFFNREQYFRKVSYSNLATNRVIFYNVTITSSYFLIIPQGMLKIGNSSDLEVIDTRYIVVSSLSEKQLNLFSDFAIVKSGLGFYVTAEMKRLHVPRAKAFLYLNNGSILELKGDLKLEGEFAVIARKPLFIAEQAKVNGVVGQSLLYPYVARDLLVRRNTTFLFLVGDSSLLYFAVNADRSKVSFISPLDIYSEWESVPLLVKHLPLSIVLTVLTIGGFKLAGLLKKSKKIKRIYEENI
jgi:hypothetical protein